MIQTYSQQEHLNNDKISSPATCYFVTCTILLCWDLEAWNAEDVDFCTEISKTASSIA